jgi:2-keto-3-deoxy-L-rhamnonate aldolase RhmA
MPWTDVRAGSSLKRRLAARETVLGSFVRMACPESVEVCGHAGFDFVVIDLEHSPMGDDEATSLVRTAEAVGVPALLRVPDDSAARIGRLLESGAAGIHVPQVRDLAHAQASIQAAKYAPSGIRGLATNRASGYGLRMSLDEYVVAANEAGLVVLQVETAGALEQVEQIAALPGCDVVFLGLTDLSLDLGITGAYDHPKLIESIERARAAAEAAGVTLGAPATSLAMARNLREHGVRYVTTNDLRLLTDAAASMCREFAAS